MWDRFPPRMRKIITAALDDAAAKNSPAATAEHLLLAMARDPECAAVFMLEDAGVAPQRVIERLETKATSSSAPRAERFDDDTLRIFHAAVIEANSRGDRHIGTEHIALALARSNGTLASQTLADLGFTQDRADASLRKWHRLGMPRRRSDLERITLTSPVLRALLRPFRAAMRYPTTLWNIFVRRSIGHPGFWKNPYPLYRKLRETEPIRLDPMAPVWIVTSYAVTLAMLKEPRFRKDPFASERLPRIAREQLSVSPAAAARTSSEMTSMLFLDPPQHTRVRSIFNKAFTPRRLESLRPRIQKLTDDLLDKDQSRGEMDLIADFAAPLPVTVIAELLGFPPEDFTQIKRWSDALADALGLRPTDEQQNRAYQARGEMHVYFDALVEKLRREPEDNLLSALLALETEGDLLNGDELFSNSVLLLAAGHETTTNLIGNGMLALLRHPGQLRELREHPELIASAVQELLRYDPPVQWTSRVAGEDFEFAGKQLQRGQIVLASVGAANRDPAVFPDPDKLDIRRTVNKHLAYGHGGHYCLGAALANMEAEIAIGTLLRRFPNLRLATKKLRWRSGVTFRGLHSLPLRF